MRLEQAASASVQIEVEMEMGGVPMDPVPAEVSLRGETLLMLITSRLRRVEP